MYECSTYTFLIGIMCIVYGIGIGFIVFKKDTYEYRTTTYPEADKNTQRPDGAKVEQPERTKKG